MPSVSTDVFNSYRIYIFLSCKEGHTPRFHGRNFTQELRTLGGIPKRSHRGLKVPGTCFTNEKVPAWEISKILCYKKNKMNPYMHCRQLEMCARGRASYPTLYPPTFYHKWPISFQIEGCLCHSYGVDL